LAKAIIAFNTKDVGIAPSKFGVDVLLLREGISTNRIVATAVAEKLAVLSTVSYFEERKSRA
jgi:hypothetical protein